MENSRLEVLSSDFPLCLGQVLDLQRDVGVLRQDLEAANTKLASSMNSIKTFWSPELKKERSMRRDELQVGPSGAKSSPQVERYVFAFYGRHYFSVFANCFSS